MFGGQGGGCGWGDDDINLERNQFGRKRRYTWIPLREGIGRFRQRVRLGGCYRESLEGVLAAEE